MNGIEEQRGRLRSLFDDQGRALRRLVTFFLVPVLLFGVLIFVPFYQQVTSRSLLEADLESATSMLASALESSEGIDAVDDLAQALNIRIRLRHEMDARSELWGELTRREGLAPDILRAWAEGSAEVDMREFSGLDSDFPQHFAASDCVWLDDRRWRECFEVAMDSPCIGRGCLVQPDLRVYIEGFPSEPLDQALAQELVDALASVETAIHRRAPTLLELVAEPDEAWRSFSRATTPPWQRFLDTVTEQRRVARAEIKRLEQKVAVLKADLERTIQLITGIEASGSAFETPLGALPVGVRELVFLYPTILGVAYLLCLSAFLRMVTLRQAFYDLSARFAEGELSAESAYLALTMALWYDPLRPAWRQAGRVILAIVPLLFMAWCYVALTALTPLISSSDSRFNAAWYEMSVILVLAASVLMLGRVLMAVAPFGKRNSNPIQ
jgi:hypothetical protein